ncbi:N-acetylmuramoyl-L-alanine amidase [Vulgatibacter incomptus]|uniref:N-acetylmuramoyl-L-alanine amidase n=1 Tax=Vulgatibacter incomptus TaxID=1391653 RepID=A0A0K1PAQ0_9BACT|nr:N-acetylmuramoyl-L-alanine amidase [Vulgatibacter incomptus]AKU90577.1 N-acetylmuramoyl-L-alanine amidase [Vulgatibacter incomptus]
MRQLGLAIALLLAAASMRVEAAHAAPNPEATYQEARSSFLELVRDNKRNRFRHHWTPVISGLDRSAKALPRGQKQCEAWFNGARAHQELSRISSRDDDRDEAIRRFRDMANRCSSSSLADDALYHAASLGRDSAPAAARKDLEQLLARYPKGDMAPKARELLADLGPARKGTAVAAAAPAISTASRAPTSASASAQAPAKVSAPASAQASTATAQASDLPSNAAPSTRSEPSAEPAADVPGAKLPSAADILASLDSRGADAKRPEDIALEVDLAKDQAASKGLDPARMQALQDAVGGEITLSLAAGLKVKRVVIDAGHGGKDTGAIARDGTHEKDLTLAIAKKLKTHLSTLGLEVLLTRDRDVFLSLEERTRFANDKHADLFISIHVNAAANKKATGIETYTLNLNSDRYAMRLAARENATSSRRIGDLELILADLATKANTDDSVRLARLSQDRMTSRLRNKYGASTIRDLGVKQALFFVLVGAKMPAILVETGFLSNPDEAKRLRSDAYQEELARSLADGVRRFIDEREAIARGDTGSQTGVF